MPCSVFIVYWVSGSAGITFSSYLLSLLFLFIITFLSADFSTVAELASLFFYPHLRSSVKYPINSAFLVSFFPQALLTLPKSQVIIKCVAPKLGHKLCFLCPPAAPWVLSRVFPLGWKQTFLVHYKFTQKKKKNRTLSVCTERNKCKPDLFVGFVWGFSASPPFTEGGSF